MRLLKILFNRLGNKSKGLAEALSRIKKKQSDDKMKEDPNEKVEKEFFEIINQEKELRMTMKKDAVQEIL